MRELSHYQILEIPPSAPRRVIRAAYRKALQRYHPDANAGDRGGEAMLRRVITAGRILSDPKRRARYDRILELERREPPPAPETPAPVSLAAGRAQRLLSGGRRLVRRFFTRGVAARTDARASRAHPRPVVFSVCLFIAISRNRTTSYQRGADGVYRKKGRKKADSARDWLRRSTVTILAGILLWPFWRG